jgi:transposase InsO family protein
MKAITDVMGVSRSNQYRKPKKTRRRAYRKSGDDLYLALIRRITDQRASYGYRRATTLLNKELEKEGRAPVNHKRVYRIMKANGLLLQRYTGLPARHHYGTIMQDRSNVRWCSDVFEIACWSGERLRIAFSMDCCDREVMGYVATTGGISGDMVRDLMVESVEQRFGKTDTLPGRIQWLSDNGPAYIAHETRRFAEMIGLDLCTTPYRSPQSNGMAEAFVKTFKRDYVQLNPLYNARHVMAQLPQWFEDYNEVHPHKALKMRSPREYRKLTSKLEECPV